MKGNYRSTKLRIRFYVGWKHPTSQCIYSVSDRNICDHRKIDDSLLENWPLLNKPDRREPDSSSGGMIAGLPDPKRY